MKIGDLKLGKIDGKFEFVEDSRSEFDPFDAFLIPEHLDPEKLNNSEKYFVYGFRGTGKTSLLRWVSHEKKKSGALTDFILFKSNLHESDRQDLSTSVGFKMQEIEAGKMEVSQDFKVAWTWFIIHKIAELASKDINLKKDQVAKKLVRLAGIDTPSFRKVLGFLPRMKGFNFTVGADIDFFKGELGAEFESKGGNQGETSLPALISKAKTYLESIGFDREVYIYLDELEVFYDEVSKYSRDQRMVRDLLFITNEWNDFFRKKEIPIHLISAVRSEVIEGMGSIGQEVDRLVYDQGIKISWHFEKRSKDHPLFEMIARKIRNSDNESQGDSTEEVIDDYFPKFVRNEPIDQYLLDRSFYRPRDLIWRLTLIQEQYPEESRFTDSVLRNTETEYSNKMWAEIAYELSAAYSKDDISSIETLISGSRDIFSLENIKRRAEELSNQSEKLKNLLSRVGLVDILQDLYRLGAVGNFFREGTSSADIRNRWAFRGDPTLLPNKQMTINYCLHKRLSIVREKRRGSRGGRR